MDYEVDGRPRGRSACIIISITIIDCATVDWCYYYLLAGTR